MADIFGRAEQIYAGGLTSDASWMFWAGMPNGGLGLLITQMSIQYQQPIRKIFEIGPWITTRSLQDLQGNNGNASGSPVYYVAGRPEGSLQIGRIAGPVAALGGWYRRYGNICNTLNTLFFVSSSGCIGGLPPGRNEPLLGFDQFANNNQANGAVRLGRGRIDPYLGWYMNGVVITTLGLAAQAQDMMVTENVQCQYVSLRLYTAGAKDPVWTEI